VERVRACLGGMNVVPACLPCGQLRLAAGVG
jgi:hypothetical protein